MFGIGTNHLVRTGIFPHFHTTGRRGMSIWWGQNLHRLMSGWRWHEHSWKWKFLTRHFYFIIFFVCVLFHLLAWKMRGSIRTRSLPARPKLHAAELLLHCAWVSLRAPQGLSTLSVALARESAQTEGPKTPGQSLLRGVGSGYCPSLASVRDSAITLVPHIYLFKTIAAHIPKFQTWVYCWVWALSFHGNGPSLQSFACTRTFINAAGLPCTWLFPVSAQTHRQVFQPDSCAHLLFITDLPCWWNLPSTSELRAGVPLPLPPLSGHTWVDRKFTSSTSAGQQQVPKRGHLRAMQLMVSVGLFPTTVRL